MPIWSSTVGPSELSRPFARWRINGGEWHSEYKAHEAPLNVCAALIKRDRANVERLLGKERTSVDMLPAGKYPDGSKVGHRTMKAVPGYPEYVIYPYVTRENIATKCGKLGKRCGVDVDVTVLDKPPATQRFWHYLRERTGGLPGQTDKWIGVTRWTSALNDKGDSIGVSLTADLIRMYVKAQFGTQNTSRNRILHFSQMMRKRMADQGLEGDAYEEADRGRTISITRIWQLDDENDWREAAEWIMVQADRLQTLVASGLAPPHPAT